MAGYIGGKVAVSAPQQIETKHTITATASQTSIPNVGYTVGAVHVYQNGIRLVDGTDYTATNGSTVTLETGATEGDQIVIVSHGSFETSDTVSKASGGTFSGNVTVSGSVTATGVGSFGSGTTVNSAAVKVAGKETIYVPAAAMYPNTTNGCADLAQVELSNGPEIKCLDFDASSDENAQFSIAFPKSWNEGTITFQAFFTVTGTNTGTVAWGLSGVGIADNASCNTAFGTNVVATAKAHSGTSNDLDVTAESGAVTVASAAVDTMTFFQIMRDVSADDQSGDARLLGIKIFFTTNAANDA